MKKIAIVQSNYIPWKGYFDLIAAVDEFVLYDDAQYTRRDWRNRNLIKTPDGPKWLSVPVEVKGKYHQSIRETRIADGWVRAHWNALAHNYGRARCFDEVAALIKPLYLERDYTLLSEVNEAFIAAICGYLRIGAGVSRSSDYDLAEGRSERLASICEQAGATVRTIVPADSLAKLRIFVAAPNAGESHEAIAFSVRALDAEAGSDQAEAFFERPGTRP